MHLKIEPLGFNYIKFRYNAEGLQDLFKTFVSQGIKLQTYYMI